MRRARYVVGFAAALLVGSALATPALADKANNSVLFASDQTLPNADPYFNANRIGVILADQVWDTLVFRDPATGEYKGNLATAWRQIDERTLELDLRQGVKFHNGAEFTADDVAYTLNFVANPANRAVSSGLIRWIDHAEKRGPFTVRVVAKQSFPAAVAFLAAANMVIHPHDYYARVGPRGMTERPVGTGPYKVVEHALGKYIRLERNGDYFKDSPKSQPKIDKIEIRFVPDAQTRVAEAIAGGLDLIMNVAPDQADQLRDIARLQIVSGETMRYSYMAMRTLDATPAPQLKDIRVRQAIMHAIDREALVKYVVGNGARVLHSECYPAQFGCTDASVPRYDYDPPKARELLAAAGYPNGFDIDIYAFRNRNQTEAVIGYLRAVGISARLRFMQANAALSAMMGGRAALVHADLGSNSIYDIAAGASNFHEFGPLDITRDMEIRDLFLSGDRATDADARAVVYAKALRLVAERAYVMPLYSMPTYYLAASDLVFKPYSDEIPRFWEMSWK
jgi:peptide/nickel transport system substrate-binding protein